MNYIEIPVENGIDETYVMQRLVCIVGGNRRLGELPYLREGAFSRSFVLDDRNDWFAALIRKGNSFHADKPPFSNNTLCVWHRYQLEPLLAVKSWLEYLFSPKPRPAKRKLPKDFFDTPRIVDKDGAALSALLQEREERPLVKNRKIRTDEWLEQNRQALVDYNAKIETHGLQGMRYRRH
jgi:post-segregation antitoxin (ccd killing protein)